MTRLCINRTATLAWAPALRGPAPQTGVSGRAQARDVDGNNGANPDTDAALPPLYVAVGSVAGALDASFSSQSELEIFAVPADPCALALADPSPSPVSPNTQPPGANAASSPAPFFSDQLNPASFSAKSSRGNSRSRFRVERVAGVTSAARFNRLAWSSFCTAELPMGAIAAGLENGELALYNPHAMINPTPAYSSSLTSASPQSTNSASSTTMQDPVFVRNASHSTAVRGLDFNCIQHNLLASGSGPGEILIWDLNKPSAPYSPGPTKTPRLAGAEIQHVAWNRCFSYILAASSTNGATVIWDLRKRHEVFSMSAPTVAQAPSGPLWNSSAASAPRQGSIVAWHPDVATIFLTALEDDANPLIYLWDLRNSHAPLRVMPGHNRGILSVSWCQRDSDLLFSCGKDNRALCWNTSTGEVVGEFPHANNWCFDVQYCPRNPDLVSVASFDGTISFNNLTPKNSAIAANVRNCSANRRGSFIGDSLYPLFPSAPGTADAELPTPFMTENDPFTRAIAGGLHGGNRTAEGLSAPQFGQPPSAVAGAVSTPEASNIVLKAPPKWLRRPCSVSWGFGGRIIHFSNSGSAPLRCTATHIPTPLYEASQDLHAALEEESLSELAEKRAAAESDEDAKATWQIISALYDKNGGRRRILACLNERSKTAIKIPENLRQKWRQYAKQSIKADESAEADSGSPGSEPVKSTTILEESNNVAEEIVESEEVKGSLPNVSVIDCLLSGDIEAATKICLNKNSLMDALLLASCGSKELFGQVRRTCLTSKQQQTGNDPISPDEMWHKIVSILTAKDFEQLLELDLNWCQIVSALVTYCPASKLNELCGYLGAVFDDCHESFGATVCYLLSGKVDKLAATWARSTDPSSSLEVSALARDVAGLSWGPAVKHTSEMLHKQIERIVIVMHAVGETKVPEQLKGRLGCYAAAVAHSGQLSIAWSYLMRALKSNEDAESTGSPCASEKQQESKQVENCILKIYADRVYHALRKEEQERSPHVPESPFEPVEVALPASQAGLRLQQPTPFEAQKPQQAQSGANQKPKYPHSQQPLNQQQQQQPASGYQAQVYPARGVPQNVFQPPPVPMHPGQRGSQQLSSQQVPQQQQQHQHQQKQILQAPPPSHQQAPQSQPPHPMHYPQQPQQPLQQQQQQSMFNPPQYPHSSAPIPPLMPLQHGGVNSGPAATANNNSNNNETVYSVGATGNYAREVGGWNDIPIVAPAKRVQTSSNVVLPPPQAVNASAHSQQGVAPPPPPLPPKVGQYPVPPQQQHHQPPPPPQQQQLAQPPPPQQQQQQQQMQQMQQPLGQHAAQTGNALYNMSQMAQHLPPPQYGQPGGGDQQYSPGRNMQFPGSRQQPGSGPVPPPPQAQQQMMPPPPSAAGPSPISANAPGAAGGQPASAGAPAGPPPPELQELCDDFRGILDAFLASPLAALDPRVTVDIERRIGLLLDTLARGQIAQQHVPELRNYVAAMNARDVAGARRAQQELAKVGFEPWMIGLRRLVEQLAASAAQGPAVAQNVGPATAPAAGGY